MKTSILLALLTFSLFFQACSNEDKSNTHKANNMLATNEYVLSDLNNTQLIAQKKNAGFSLDNAEGKVIIFDIFATWCPPCRAAASHLSSLQEKYKDNPVTPVRQVSA